MKNNLRHYSLKDQLCITLDNALRAIDNHPKTSDRPYPGIDAEENAMTEAERRHAAGLMRVNHAGEVSAQALYHGQAWVSKSEDVKNKMHTAALEEGDHLHWCYTRLMELHSHPSYLNLVWYLGSFAIGVTAGVLGDRLSLGFVSETEHQVVKHLENHLAELPASDQKSQKILQQMQIDEAHHRDDAIQAGAAELPFMIKGLMRLVSKIMVKTAYWI
jgi:ubiquinone biosynthesis monooxygenase Coq7